MKTLKLRQIATLILWAGIVGLVTLAAVIPVELSMGESFEVDSESSDLFDETEDDFLSVTMSAATIVNLLLSKAGAMPLYFRIAPLSPLSPPPKLHFS